DVGVGVVELLRALVRPGDGIVISPPVYPPFFDWVPEAGGRTLEVPLVPRDGRWRLDLDGLERAFAAHPAAYVLCNPHNPVGTVHSPEELEALVRLARIYRVVLVSDEIHAPLVLPGAVFTPLLTVPGAAELAVSVVSASKAWNLAGLKCAAVVTASAAMMPLVDRFPPDARWRIGHLGVIAAVAAYREGGAWLDQLLRTLDDRRSVLAELLAERLPGVRWQPPEATFLAWLDCRGIGPGDAARELFLERGKVALEPGLRFGAQGAGYARLNFATSAGLLDQATKAMSQAAADGSLLAPGDTVGACERRGCTGPRTCGSGRSRRPGRRLPRAWCGSLRWVSAALTCTGTPKGRSATPGSPGRWCRGTRVRA
ncbi:MAG TPA: aminotransferase class I/II-fold pyridoxal phosphate-dependent enzyme, partial [Trebonia sp.]